MHQKSAKVFDRSVRYNRSFYGVMLACRHESNLLSATPDYNRIILTATGELWHADENKTWRQRKTLCVFYIASLWSGYSLKRHSHCTRRREEPRQSKHTLLQCRTLTACGAARNRATPRLKWSDCSHFGRGETRRKCRQPIRSNYCYLFTSYDQHTDAKWFLKK